MRNHFRPLYLRSMRRLLWGLGLLALVCLGLNARPISAAAADNVGFNIVTSPLPIKLNTAPGRTVTTELRIKNQGIKSEAIKVGLMKFGATGEQGQPNLFDIGPKDEFAKWVSFSPAQFEAQPNVWYTVKMTIKVPPEASLGYYMAVTFSRAAQAGEPESTSVRGSAATLVLLEVHTANEKRNIELLDFTSDKRVYEYLPATFTVKVRNKGNIYIAPTGNIFITKGNKPVTSITFNEIGGSVLPSSNRVYKLPWDSGFPLFTDRIVNGKPVIDKHAVPKRDLKWDFSQLSKFRFGKYSAKLLLVYDDGVRDVPLESTLTFWVIPYKIMIVTLIVALLLTYALYSLIRNFVRKAKLLKPRREK